MQQLLCGTCTSMNTYPTSLDETCALTQWYEGPILLEAIDGFLLPASRSLPLSFRPIINDVLSIDKNRGRYEVAITVLQGAVSTRRTTACYACTADNASTDGPQHYTLTITTMSIIPGACFEQLMYGIEVTR